jgi:RDD family
VPQFAENVGTSALRGQPNDRISMAPMAGCQPRASLGKRLEALALTALLLVVTFVIGWLIWSVFEWRKGQTPSYRLLGLRIVRLSDEQPIRLGRSFARACICCLLVIPTIVICCVIGISYTLGASPPDGLLRRPRSAPWDYLTATKVTDERAQLDANGDFGHAILEPIDLAGATRATGTRNNGHAH